MKYILFSCNYVFHSVHEESLFKGSIRSVGRTKCYCSKGAYTSEFNKQVLNENHRVLIHLLALLLSLSTSFTFFSCYS
ncbi:hypothetical protein Lalb_Chr09g0330971 [Lupinus albus]|uniref:Uncharacterized protein n=1 Tax=Lupinus albus TaxID=3870 RepID=A0A6A4Q0Q1_LUPAL|nr:hypothetical protein Lalb_Chr09g0330971 [Lupinus albus]